MSRPSLLSFSLFLIVFAAITAWSIRLGGDRVPLATGVVEESIAVNGQRFQAVTVELHDADVRLHWSSASPGQTFATCDRFETESGRHALFLTNAGIFDKQHAPLGLHVEEGRVMHPINRSSGPGNFFLQPNGVFVIDSAGHARVLQTADYDNRIAPRFAFQSGPMLILKGEVNAGFSTTSLNLAVRSGVGVDNSGRVIFVLSDAPCTFAALAAVFRDELHCSDALYLDGTISRFAFPSLSPLDDAEIFAAIAVADRPRR